MILNLTDFSDEPLQSQIYRQIRAMILAGELSAGEMLPSIRKLAKEEKVSVITVQRGYDLLERESLIVSRRGKGFFVADIRQDKRKELAGDKLSEKLEPVLNAAVSEGMTIEEILKVVKEVLGK